METKQYMKELLPFYGLRLLENNEQRQVEAYLATDAAAQLEVAEYEAVSHLLPMLAPSVAPPARVKQQLMARIAADKAATRPVAQRQPTGSTASAGWLTWLSRLFFPPVSPALVGVTAVLLLLFGGWALSLNQQAATQTVALNEAVTTIADLETAVDTLTQRNVMLEQQQEMQSLVLARLANPESQLVAVPPTDATSAAAGQLLVSGRDNSLIFLSNELATLDANQTYQFWVIPTDGTPISGGTFAPDEAGQVQLVVDVETAVSDLVAVGVSIEPAGGSEQPTADQIILLGEL